MKSNNEITTEIINSNDVKLIKNMFYSRFETGLTASEAQMTAETLAELISKNSNDFTRDIAAKYLKGYQLSEKQSWCLAFQIKNNIEVYKIAMAEYSEECANLIDED